MRYIDNEQKLMDKTADIKRRCKCGHTQLLKRSKGREYDLCTWCGSRLYYDKHKQLIYDEKCLRDEFRFNIFKYLEASQREVM